MFERDEYKWEIIRPPACPPGNPTSIYLIYRKNKNKTKKPKPVSTYHVLPRMKYIGVRVVMHTREEFNYRRFTPVWLMKLSVGSETLSTRQLHIFLH